MFSGEELGLRGSFAYVDEHTEEVTERARLVLNVDLSSDPIGQDVFHALGTKELLGYAGGIARENGLMFKENLGTYSSDCMPFAVHEVPSVNVVRTGGSGIYHVHTKSDTASNVSARGMEPTARAVEALLDRILFAQIYPVKKEIDDSLKDRIEKYLWGVLRRKPELNWEE